MRQRDHGHLHRVSVFPLRWCLVSRATSQDGRDAAQPLQAVQAEAWATLTSKRKKGAPTSATLPRPVVPSPHLNNRFLMLTTYAFGGTRPARVCPKESTSPLGVAAALFSRGCLEAIPRIHVLDDFLRDRRTLCRDHAQLVEAGDEL